MDECLLTQSPCFRCRILLILICMTWIFLLITAVTTNSLISLFIVAWWATGLNSTQRYCLVRADEGPSSMTDLVGTGPYGTGKPSWEFMTKFKCHLVLVFYPLLCNVFWFDFRCYQTCAMYSIWVYHDGAYHLHFVTVKVCFSQAQKPKTTCNTRYNQKLPKIPQKQNGR